MLLEQHNALVSIAVIAFDEGKQIEGVTLRPIKKSRKMWVSRRAVEGSHREEQKTPYCASSIAPSQWF